MWRHGLDTYHAQRKWFPRIFDRSVGEGKMQKKKSNRSQQRRAKTLKHVKEPDKKLAWLPH